MKDGKEMAKKIWLKSVINGRAIKTSITRKGLAAAAAVTNKQHDKKKKNKNRNKKKVIRQKKKKEKIAADPSTLRRKSETSLVCYSLVGLCGVFIFFFFSISISWLCTEEETNRREPCDH